MQRGVPSMASKSALVLIVLSIVLLFGPARGLRVIDSRLHRVAARANRTTSHQALKMSTSPEPSEVKPAGSSKPSLKYGGLHHCGLLVRDTEASKQFYMEVFGFEDDTHLRPKTLPYPGAFLRVGPNQIHLMQLPIMDPLEGRPEHGGRDRHTAVTVSSIDILAERLKERGIAYTLSSSGRRALFCRDLDQNAFEFMEETRL